MSLTEFKMESLTTIDDGRVAVAFEHALRRAEIDCRDRPAVGKARTVTLTAQLVPRTDEQGKELLEVLVQFKVDDSLPARGGKVYHMLAGKSRGLFFNEMAPEDARQLTIPVGPRPTSDEELQPQRKDIVS